MYLSLLIPGIFCISGALLIFFIVLDTRLHRDPSFRCALNAPLLTMLFFIVIGTVLLLLSFLPVHP